MGDEFSINTGDKTSVIFIEDYTLSWKNRSGDKTGLKVTNMAKLYWFSILYCLLEKFLSGVDYKKTKL